MWEEIYIDIDIDIGIDIIFYNESGRTLAQIAQGGGGCPIPGNTQGQVECGSEQPDLVENVPGHGRGVGLHDL